MSRYVELNHISLQDRSAVCYQTVLVSQETRKDRIKTTHHGPEEQIDRTD